MAVLTLKSLSRVSVAGQNPSFHFALVKNIPAIFSTCWSHALGLPTAITAASCILLTPPPASAIYVPPPASAIYVYYGDSKYTTVYGPTWGEAQANAVKIGGNLVTINDAAENAWLMANIPWIRPSNPFYGAYGYDNSIAYWIGLTDQGDKEGQSYWISGEQSAFRVNGPSDAYGTEDWFTLVRSVGSAVPLNGEWNDLTQTPGDWSMGHWQMEYGIAEIKLSAPSGTSTASVPGPLPILGLAAAFGFSRKLRKRIETFKRKSE